MAVSKLAAISMVAFLTAMSAMGFVMASSVAAVASPTFGVAAAQTDQPTTTVPGGDTTTTAPETRRSASGTTHTVTIGLLSIAGVTAVMATAYFWYTIPSRRSRIAERRR